MSIKKHNKEYYLYVYFVFKKFKFRIPVKTKGLFYLSWRKVAGAVVYL
jgi:hypothetical protein